MPQFFGTSPTAVLSTLVTQASNSTVYSSYGRFLALLIGTSLVVGAFYLFDMWTDADMRRHGGLDFAGGWHGPNGSGGRPARGSWRARSPRRAAARSSLQTFDAKGREYQGSSRVYRERDTGAPLPTQGSFGEWLERDRS